MKLHVTTTDEEIEKFILDNWRNIGRKDTLAALKIGGSRYTKAWGRLAAKGKVPLSRPGSPKKAHISKEDAKTYLLLHYELESRDYMIQKGVMGATMYYRALRELTDEGLITKRPKGQKLKQPDPPKPMCTQVRDSVLYGKLVPDSFVNHGCRWMAA